MMATSTDAGARAVQFARGSKVGCIADLLAARREEILGRWLEAAAAQPWHRGRREHAVAHHIPRLFDALLDLWRRLAAGSEDPTLLLNNPAVLAAAEAHARDRFDLGLQPQEVITEFRLLRQEIWRVLYLHLMNRAPNGKVLGAEVLVHDTLDGTVSVALTALLKRAEEMREDFLAALSHDMRHPITAIKSSLQLAERAVARPEPDLARVTDSLHRAEAATDQMLTLVGRLLHASRFALGSLAMQVEQVDLRRLLDAAVKRLDPATAGRVQLEVPAKIDATGCWDPAALGQVLDNLLDRKSVV
jgi:signal transduction histidine kinase